MWTNTAVPGDESQLSGHKGKVSASAARTVPVCQQQITASGPFRAVSFSFFLFFSTQTKAVGRWDDTSASLRLRRPVKHVALTWSEPKANTVKGPETKPSTWTQHTALPKQRYFESLLFGSFHIPASALHRKMFLGHSNSSKKAKNISLRAPTWIKILLEKLLDLLKFSYFFFELSKEIF